MSHYAVAIFAKDSWDFDRLMRPYSENNEEYFEFIPISAESLAEKRASWEESHDDTTDFDTWMTDYGLEKRDGQWGYMANPHGYYDYYTLDGRDGDWDLKEPHDFENEGDDYVDCYYRVNQYDFAPDQKAYDEALRFYECYVEGKQPQPDVTSKENGKPRMDGETQYDSFYKKEWYEQRYGSKEQYAKECAASAPYAFVTSDGEWVAPGRVGWFAMSDETKESYNEYLEKWYAYVAAHPDELVSFTDCHI